MRVKQKQRQKHKELALLQAEGKQVVNAYPSLSRLPKEIDAKVFLAEQTRFESRFKAVKDGEVALNVARGELKQDVKTLRKYIKRVRGAVMAIYGDDSQELELVGAKRVSQRKRPVRRRKASGGSPPPVAKAA